MAAELDVSHTGGGLLRGSGVDRAIADLAERQHGVVSRRQLSGLGVGPRAIEHRVACGRLHRVHRGVYAVGHARLSPRGRLMGAVLAAGPGAFAGRRSAAPLWDLPAPAARGIEVTVPRARRARPGLTLRAAFLPADERTILDGIPVTTVPRTLLDLAAVVAPHQLERAVNDAERRRLTDPLSLEALASRYPGRRGVAAVRALLAARRIGLSVTRSELESRFLVVLDSAGLPRPVGNTFLPIRGRSVEVDCVWVAQRVIVELDGRSFHEQARAFEEDRLRDRELAVAGWRVVRVTWRQLHEGRAALIADLRALLVPDGRN